MGDTIFSQDYDRNQAFSSSAGPFLQRKCACGNHSLSGECDSCRKKSTGLGAGLGERPAISQPLETSTLRSVGESPIQFLHQSDHDFSRVRAHASATVINHNAGSDEGQVTSTKSGQDKTGGQSSPKTDVGSPPQTVPANTQGPSSTTAAACPTKTVAEAVTNQNCDGVKYRTGMGAVATMKVEPDTQTWDGTSVVESFPTAATSTCPTEFGINPCAGNSTFPIGQNQTSSVFGSLPAKKNHFYDLHETRWKGGSLLHDRNPKGIDSCTIACDQNYSCGGAVIGKHTITRTFTKGTVGSVNVTFVSVAKT